MSGVPRPDDLTASQADVLAHLRATAHRFDGWTTLDHRPYGRFATLTGRRFDRATLRALDDAGYVDDYGPRGSGYGVHLTAKALEPPERTR